MIHHCENCGKEFKRTPKQPHKKFCSRNCYHAHRTKVIDNPTHKTCIYCNKIYTQATGITSQNFQKSRFCSKECYWNYRREHPEIKIQSTNENKIELICNHCGKKYKTHKYRINSSKYCSRACKTLAGRNTQICSTCGRPFIHQKHRLHRYCSQTCANKGVDKRKSSFSEYIKSLLIKYDFTFEEEYRISDNNRSIWCDFCINDNLIIECFGDYWHCNPKIYDGAYFHAKIKKYAHEIWDYDNKRFDFILKKNYIYIRIWESELKNIDFEIELLKQIEEKFNEI